MIFIQRYNYRLYPNNSQIQLLNNHFFSNNQTWNILLSLHEKQYNQNIKLKDEGKEPSYLSLTDRDSEVKRILSGRNLIFNTKVIQQERRVFDQSMNNLRKSKSGFLKYKKSSKLEGSLETTQEQFQIKDFNSKFKILRLFNQSFKFRYHRILPSNPKTLTISLKNGVYTLSFTVEVEVLEGESKHSKNFHKDKGEVNAQSITSSFGLDININKLDIAKSKRVHSSFSNSQYNISNIKRLQKKQSRRVEKSKKEKVKLGVNFYKTQQIINKKFNKVNNKRNDELHKKCNEIINFIKSKGGNTLVVEDLSVKSMTSSQNFIKKIGKKNSKSMRKNILTIQFGKLLETLKYKCAVNEIYFKKVNPKYTSKLCSKCGNIDKSLSIVNRTYRCNKCGLVIDRDLNACLNIKMKFEYFINTGKELPVEPLASNQ